MTRPEKGFYSFNNPPTPTQLADDIIYARDFEVLEGLLKELWVYRAMTCDHCGLLLSDHKDDRVAVRSCD